MEAVVQKRELAVVTAEIMTIKVNTQRMVLENSIEIGRRLCEAKELVGHGGWGRYLEETVEFSQSTANNLMRIYREYGDEQLQLGKPAKCQMFGNLTYSQAVALLILPEEAREELVEEHDLTDTSVNGLKKLIEEKERALQSLGQALEEERELRMDKESEAMQQRQRVEELEGREVPEEIRQSIEAAARRQAEEEAKAMVKAAKEKAAEKLEQAQGERDELREEAERESILRGKLEEEKKAALERADALERKLRAAGGGECEIAFKVHFEELQRQINRLVEILENVKRADSETGTRYRTAMLKYADIFRERVEEV